VFHSAISFLQAFDFSGLVKRRFASEVSKEIAAANENMKTVEKGGSTRTLGAFYITSKAFNIILVTIIVLFTFLASEYLSESGVHFSGFFPH